MVIRSWSVIEWSIIKTIDRLAKQSHNNFKRILCKGSIRCHLSFSRETGVHGLVRNENDFIIDVRWLLAYIYSVNFCFTLSITFHASNVITVTSHRATERHRSSTRYGLYKKNPAKSYSKLNLWKSSNYWDSQWCDLQHNRKTCRPNETKESRLI